MNGFQLLRWIRACADLEQLPVVVLTASLDEEDSQACYKLGANSFVIKPCSLDNLRKTIKQISDRWLARKPSEPVPFRIWQAKQTIASAI